MASCSNCIATGKIFTFHNEQVTYNEAIERCRSKTPSQTLAQRLSKTAYQSFPLCCLQRRSYWIGLQMDHKLCKNQMKSFHWVGDDTCFTGRPLTIQRQSNSSNDCSAVTIVPRLSLFGNVSPARVRDCNQLHGYICQRHLKPIVPTTRSTYITIRPTSVSSEGGNIWQQKPAETFATTTKTTLIVPSSLTTTSTRVPRNFVKSVAARKVHSLSTTSPRTAESSDGVNNFLVAGVCVGFAIAFFLVLLMLWMKKRNNKTNHNVTPTRVKFFSETKSENYYPSNDDINELSKSCEGTLSIKSKDIILTRTESDLKVEAFRNIPQFQYGRERVPVIQPYEETFIRKQQKDEKQEKEHYLSMEKISERIYMKPFN